MANADGVHQSAWFGECDFYNPIMRGPIVLVNAWVRSATAAKVNINVIRGGMWNLLSASSFSGFPLEITHSPYVNDLTPIGTYAITGTCAVLDAFRLTSANNAKVIATDRIFGEITADYGGVIEAGCQLLCTGNRPTVAGAFDEVLIGATVAAWATATIDAARLCGVSVSP